MDGCTALDFMFFFNSVSGRNIAFVLMYCKTHITHSLTVFQSYQDEGLMIMKCCVQWNSRLKLVLNPGPLDQQVNAYPSALLGILYIFDNKIHI